MTEHDTAESPLADPPAAYEAEGAILGAMMQDVLAIAIAREHNLTPDDFCHKAHRDIYAAISRRFENEQSVDHITLADDLRRKGKLDSIGGTRKLGQLVNMRANVPHVADYVKTLKIAAVKRWSLAQATQIAALSRNGASPDEITRRLEETSRIMAQRSAEIETPQSTARARFKLIPAPEFKMRPAPTFLIENVLVEGSLSTIEGAPGTFKSFIAVSLAGAVSTGCDWHGHPVQQGTVIYLSGEGSAGLGQRIRAWEIANNVEMPANCYFLPEAVQFLDNGEIGALIEEIKALPEAPVLIIIDTLARCLVGGDENAARDMGLYVAGAQRLQQACGAHILTIHHHNKAGGLRGSSALPGALDTRITVERKDDHLTLKCDKQKDAPEFEPIGMVKRVVELDETGQHTSLVFDSAAQTVQQAEAGAGQRKALDILNLHENGLRASEWQALCEGAGIKRRTFFNYRDALEAQRLIHKVGQSYVSLEN